MFHSVFWNMIQVTSCDDMMINRITAVGPFEGGTTKTVTRRGLVRSGLCSFLCTPGLVVTARLPLVRGSSRRPRARRTGHLGGPGTGAGVRRVHRSVRAAAPPAPTLARIGRPCSSQLYQVTLQPGVPGHAHPGQLRDRRSLRSGAGSRRAARLRVACPWRRTVKQPRPGRMAQNEWPGPKGSSAEWRDRRVQGRMTRAEWPAGKDRKWPGNAPLVRIRKNTEGGD